VAAGSDISGVVGRIETVTGFDDFFVANYCALTRVIYRVVGDPDCAEELASEAFWRLHRKPPANEDNLVGWLYRTGLRLALDHLKKRNRRSHYEGLAAAAYEPQTPETVAQQIERQTRVRRVLARINRRHTALLILRSEGHSLAEMASILHLNPGSIGTFLARADAAFRKEYLKLNGDHD
jgi:RNA polymerase sigma-70 factor (ECF subfamily)